jgi:zinc and cadmium transporter
MQLSLFAALIGIAGACAGAYVPPAHGRARLLVPVSGAILLAVSLFSILPEMAGEAGWLRAGILYGCGYSLLYVIDRYIHPVCPSCSHTHDHLHCEVELHGFSVPLVIATAIHSFVDGWAMAVAQNAATGSMRTTIPIAVLLHKIPEGLALGVMLRASLKSPGTAAAWGFAAESATAVGALLAMSLLPGASPVWARDLLAVAGGTFLYLGFHAVHGALGWRLLPRRG